MLAARIDNGLQIPATLPGVHLSPLNICIAECLLSHAVTVHLHERLAIPPTPPGGQVTQDSSTGTASVPCSGNLQFRNSSPSSTIPNQCNANFRDSKSSSYDPTDLTDLTAADVSEIVPRIVELARQGLQLCRGVPLLLHVLVQVAVSCQLCPDSYTACSTFEYNLNILQRSTTAPLRLTSLVVRQVYACLGAQLGQASMAGAHQSGVLALRVLESCPLRNCCTLSVPNTVRLARHSFDDASLPLQLIPPSPAILNSPSVRFLTATMLWHSGCAHVAHALIGSTAVLLVEQVASLRTTQNSSLMQEVLQPLHMALSVQGASLLPSSAVSGLVTALKVLLSYQQQPVFYKSCAAV